MCYQDCISNRPRAHYLRGHLSKAFIFFHDISEKILSRKRKFFPELLNILHIGLRSGKDIHLKPAKFD